MSNDYKAKIAAQWSTRRFHKMNWLEFEQVLIDILRDIIPPNEAIALCKEAIDAYTKRGQFNSNEYPTQHHLVKEKTK